MWFEMVLFLGFGLISAIGLSDADLHLLPRLFYLDDYERCLARPTALYCVGSFHITPASTPNRVYDVLKELSLRKDLYNRTLLHRGYCVTSRCPNSNKTGNLGDAEWFENCVQKWASPLQLKASLKTLNYCRRPIDSLKDMQEAQQVNSYHNLLLQITYAVIAMNIVGTLYDLMLYDKDKNDMLLAWSIRGNWRRLVADFNPGPNRRYTAFKSIEGVRVFLLIIVLLLHTVQSHVILYLANPTYLEKFLSLKVSMLLKNCLSIVQAFIMIASFLFTYNKLVNSNKQRLSLVYTPKDILTRIARISPTYIVLILFASSWWPLLSDGPMWQMVVSNEQKICKRKFWYHLFFISNHIDPTSHCQEQSWSIAVDIQLRIIASIVSNVIAQFNLPALKVLRNLFLGSCLFNVVMCYTLNIKAVFFAQLLERLRIFFKDDYASTIVYTSVWGSLPACILGMYVAHKHYYEEVDGKKIQHSKLFIVIATMTIPLLVVWVLLGNLVVDVDNRLFIAIYTGLERPIFTLLCAVKLYACCKRLLDGPIHRVLSDHVFCVLGRLSLSAMMVHWCIIMFVVAARPVVFYTGVFEIFVDTTKTWVMTYMLSVPLTVLLEMPAYRSLSILMDVKRS